MTPSVDQRVGVTLPGEVGVDVFTGSPGTLVKFGCHTYFWTWQPEFRFDASSGSEYFIMVSVPSGWVDAVSISFDVAPQGPSNDDFSSATVIGSYDFTDTVDADNATEWFDDPLCTYWRAQHTVWYRYTPPANARVHIDTLGSTMKGAIAVYKGSRGNLTQLTDCDYFGTQPQLSFRAKGGVTYRIMVGTLADTTGPISFAFRSRLVSTLSLKASRDVLTYGTSVRLSGHLKGFVGGSTPTVSIYRRGGSAPLLSRTVDGSGDFSARLKPKENTTYEARWGGDGHYAKTRSPRASVHVRVILRAQLAHDYGKSGSYHLFHRATDPLYLVTVRPNHHGQYVWFKLQRFASGSWRSLGKEPFSLNKYSRVGVVVRHRALVVGTDYRIMARFPNDDDHVGNSAPWSYFRMTS
jgi:hypothetical protein